MVPRLRTLLGRAGSERERLVGMNPEIEKARQNAVNDGGTLLGSQYLKHLNIFRETVGRILGLGVLIKDLGNGLVDFPYEYNGRIVYLCWKLGEDEIEWWHEVEAGFMGRHPVSDDFE